MDSGALVMDGDVIQPETVVRLARDDDLLDVWMLIMQLGAEFPETEINKAKILEFIQHIKEHGFLIVVEYGDKIVGTSAVLPQQWWFSDGWYLEDYWTYLSEEGRRFGVAKALFKKLKELSDRTKMPLILGVLTLKQVERKNILFRRFFTPIGERFAYNLFPEG